MASGSGSARGVAADGRKRKKLCSAAAGAVVEAPAMKREPRRGMGVAELERIRVELEMAETCGYAIVPSLSAAAAAAHHHFPPTTAPPCFVPAGVAMAAAYQYARTQHAPADNALPVQVVGNGAVKVEYFTPCYRVVHQHYAANDSNLTRFVTSNAPASSHQKNQVDQKIQSAVTTAQPAAALGRAQSSESSSSSYQQLRDHGRDQLPLQFGKTREIAFVDLADSDDDDGNAVQELDLELKL